MRAIVDQVLDFSQMENETQMTAKIELKHAPLSLRAMCEQLVDILSSRVGANRVDFGVHYSASLMPDPGDDDGEQWVVGDEFRLRQVLINLCDNAVKFARQGSGEVTLKMRLTKCASFDLPGNRGGDTRLCEREGARADALDEGGAARHRTRRLTVEVQDNGIGIDKDKLYLLFKPFSQVHSDLSRRYGGTGLGLAITKAVVDSMDGSIRCISKGENNGSTFSVEVPLMPCPPHLIPAQPPLPRLLCKSVCVSVPRGPSRVALIAMCKQWGLGVTDYSFPDLLPSNDIVARLWAQVQAHSAQQAVEQTQTQQVYVMDMSVFVALSQIPGATAVLSQLAGVIVGYVSDQVQLRKMLQGNVSGEANVPQSPTSTLGGSAEPCGQSAGSMPPLLPTTPARRSACNLMSLLAIEAVTDVEGEGSSAQLLRETMRARWVTAWQPIKSSVFRAKLAQCSKAGFSAAPGNVAAAAPDHHDDVASRQATVCGDWGKAKQQTRSGGDGLGHAGVDLTMRSDEIAEARGNGEGQVRILLVEDHAANQKVALRIIQKVLGAANVKVDVANDGFEAIDLVTKNQGVSYKVIFMDVQMPGCDGLQATRKIRAWEEREQRARTPICALTAHANDSDVQACIDSGMDRYLSKPINVADIRDLLLFELDGREMPCEGFPTPMSGPATPLS